MANKISSSRFDNLLKAARDSSSTEGDRKKSKSTDSDYTRTTVYLPKKIHKRLKSVAADDEREISEIVEELVTEWLVIKNKLDI